MKSGYLKGKLNQYNQIKRGSDFHDHDLTKTVVLYVKKLSLLIILQNR